MNNMLIGVITSTLSSWPPEVRRGATSGLQRTCFYILYIAYVQAYLPGWWFGTFLFSPIVGITIQSDSHNF